MSGTYLDAIVADVRRRSAAAPAGRADVAPDPARRARFTDALRAPGVSVIAELKRRSPSAGAIAAGDDLAARAAAYAAGGAAALSVLTEPDHFGGAPGDLAVAAGAGLPRLRKDFLLTEEDVRASLALGADAVLLIAAILPGDALARLRAEASRCGLAVLCEVHDGAELERALAVEPECVGVNARNLASFEVDLGVVERLVPRIPARFVRVAESGVRGPAELARVRDAGADAALVGEALMRASDPARTLRALRGSPDAPAAEEVARG